MYKIICYFYSFKCYKTGCHDDELLDVYGEQTTLES